MDSRRDERAASRSPGAGAGGAVSMGDAAKRAAALLKALANEDRLLVLCHLADGEKNVGELQDILGIRQPTLSQQLSRLRAERLVETRRTGRVVYYRLESEAAGRIIEVLYELYCSG